MFFKKTVVLTSFVLYAVCLGPQLSKLAASAVSEPFVKCLHRLNDHSCIY